MSWLDNYSTTNTFRSIYINGFIDISGGRLQTRSSTDGHLMIAGDASLNGNLYVGGDISWNPNSLANDSIPSSAIIGGAVGATGPAGTAGTAGSSTEIMLFDAVTQGTGINTTSNMYNLEWMVYGSVNFFANTSAKRCLLYHTTANRHYHCISINLQPGVYKVTVSAIITEALIWGFDNDHSGKFLWPNGSGTEDGEWNQPDPTIVITTPVYSNTNFHICLRDVGTVSAINNRDAQILFERIGTVQPSGQSDQELADIGTGTSYATFANQETISIQGGLYWSSSVTKPTDPNEYIDLNESGTEWIYRIDPNTTSSVEVASFHSDADLSLNKRLFVGEDVSLNGNLYVGGDISWNPTSLANNSIPSSAVATQYMILNATNHTNTYSYGLTQMDYEIYGSTDILADQYCLRSQTTSNSYKSLSMLFNPGVYRVTIDYRRGDFSGLLWFGFDLDHDNLVGFTDEEPGYISNNNQDAHGTYHAERVFIVPNKTNFHYYEQSSSNFYNYPNGFPQIIFYQIDQVESSGSDDTLSQLSGWHVTDTKLINGGIYW